MRDRDIRRLLRSELVMRFGGDPSTIIIDEMGVCSGTARVDLAVVNGELKGFEIKSERDTLARLEGQLSVYGRVFDTVSIVLDPKHLRRAQSLIPRWWGMTVVEPTGDRALRLSEVRSEKRNEDQDPLALAQLLWREEALHVLRKAGLSRGLTNKPRRFLWQELARSFALPVLSGAVREVLKRRENWKVDASRTLDGEKFRPCARS